MIEEWEEQPIPSGTTYRFTVTNQAGKVLLSEEDVSAGLVFFMKPRPETSVVAFGSSVDLAFLVGKSPYAFWEFSGRKLRIREGVEFVVKQLREQGVPPHGL